jgi:hypothetical protein
MKSILATVMLLVVLSLGIWQMKTEGVKESSMITQEQQKGMQCPALYGIPGQTSEENLPNAIKHCKCEIGAMLEQKDGSFRCSYCGKTENE